MLKTGIFWVLLNRSFTFFFSPVLPITMSHPLIKDPNIFKTKINNHHNNYSNNNTSSSSSSSNNSNSINYKHGHNSPLTNTSKITPAVLITPAVVAAEKAKQQINTQHGLSNTATIPSKNKAKHRNAVVAVRTIPPGVINVHSQSNLSENSKEFFNKKPTAAVAAARIMLNGGNDDHSEPGASETSKTLSKKHPRDSAIKARKVLLGEDNSNDDHSESGASETSKTLSKPAKTKGSNISHSSSPSKGPTAQSNPEEFRKTTLKKIQQHVEATYQPGLDEAAADAMFYGGRSTQYLSRSTLPALQSTASPMSNLTVDVVVSSTPTPPMATNVTIVSDANGPTRTTNSKTTNSTTTDATDTTIPSTSSSDVVNNSRPESMGVSDKLSRLQFQIDSTRLMLENLEKLWLTANSTKSPAVDLPALRRQLESTRSVLKDLEEEFRRTVASHTTSGVTVPTTISTTTATTTPSDAIPAMSSSSSSSATTANADDDTGSGAVNPAATTSDDRDSQPSSTTVTTTAIDAIVSTNINTAATTTSEPVTTSSSSSSRTVNADRDTDSASANPPAAATTPDALESQPSSAEKTPKRKTSKKSTVRSSIKDTEQENEESISSAPETNKTVQSTHVSSVQYFCDSCVDDEGERIENHLTKRRWRCQKCANFDQCDDCKRNDITRHRHKCVLMEVKDGYWVVAPEQKTISSLKSTSSSKKPVSKRMIESNEDTAQPTTTTATSASSSATTPLSKRPVSKRMIESNEDTSRTTTTTPTPSSKKPVSKRTIERNDDTTQDTTTTTTTDTDTEGSSRKRRKSMQSSSSSEKPVSDEMMKISAVLEKLHARVDEMANALLITQQKYNEAAAKTAEASAIIASIPKIKKLSFKTL